MRTILLFLFASLAAGQTPAPVLSLAVNGSGEGEVFRGWPLVVQVSLQHPQRFATGNAVPPIAIDPAALAVRVIDSTGSKIDWPLQPLNPPAGPLVLDAVNAVELTWILTPEATQNLALGDYQLGAAVGSAASPAVALKVLILPAPLSPDQAYLQGLLLGSYFMLTRDPDKALAAVGQILAGAPGDANALELKGDILAGNDDPDGALEAYGAAINAILVTDPKPREAPRTLLRKYNELLFPPP